ncbi:MAG: TonB-dependent receptor [Polyangiaceae bacterium]|nr:TonB-dependent receptor [Polyangiaceae bacterium]
MNRSLRQRRGAYTIGVLGALLGLPSVALGQGAPPQSPAPSNSAPANPPPPPPSGDAPAAEEEGDGEVIDVDTPPPPVPADKGVVTGVVVEGSNSDPIIEAQVSVVGTQTKTLTDLDGRFRLVLPPGTYDLRVFYEGHKARRIQKVVVSKGQSLEVNVSLDTEEAAPEPVREIEVVADRSNAQTQILIRKNAANTGDSVSAQDIAKTPDRNAAEAAKRVVGATILDGRFVLVRGLGERYTNALLNGSPLPSPEPDRQAVPLDLFPSLVLSDIAIVKTFTPDMPGDFAGGSVSIHTRQPSETFQISASLSLGVNTVSTFQDKLGYAGGGLDFVGIDSGKRNLPKNFPTYKLVSGGAKPDGSQVSDQEVWDAGKRINSSMATNRSTAPVNHGFNAVGGGTISLGKAGTLGAVAALTYGRRFSIVKDAIVRRFNFALDPNDPNKPFPYFAAVDAKGEIGTDSVSWGGLAVLSWTPSSNHRFSFTGLTSRSSDNETRILTGPNEGAGFAVLEDTRLRFVSRGLFFGEFQGEHKLPALKGAEVRYRLSGSLATLDEPDTRQTSYLLMDDGNGKVTRFWDATPTLSGQHFFGSQSEQSIGGALDLTQPIVEGPRALKVKAGLFIQARERSFDTRRFHFRQLSGVPFTEYLKPADEIFVDENLGTKVDFNEWTQATDTYTASTHLYAGYLMADFSPFPWMRAIGGARIEAWSQNLASFDRFVPDTKVESGQDTLDVLPSLALIFKTTRDSNLRVSISRTVARPQLRELAPFLFTDYVGARDQVGNPNLKVSSIVNGDVRFELFPAAADVVAVSAFYKQFYDPIEAIILGGSSNELITYENAKSARVLGMEIELKKGLGFLTPALSDLSALANVTVSSSRVELDPELGIQTNNVRPLVGQSPVVVNIGVDYSNDKTGTRGRLVYNVSAPRIRAAGSNNLLDTYEQPRHLLDVSIAQRIGKLIDLKLTAENLLQAPFRATFGKDNEDSHVVEERQPGTTFTLSATVTN